MAMQRKPLIPQARSEFRVSGGPVESAAPFGRSATVSHPQIGELAAVGMRLCVPRAWAYAVSSTTHSRRLHASAMCPLSAKGLFWRWCSDDGPGLDRTRSRLSGRPACRAGVICPGLSARSVTALAP